MNRSLRIVLAGAAGLAVGLGAGFAVGSSETRTTTETVASSPASTQTAPPPADAPSPTATARSSPAPKARAQGPKARSRAAPPAPREEQRFSGTGNRRLGTITVLKPSILSWTSKGTRFEIRYAAGSVAVASVAKAGSIPVPPAVYPAVRVAASGRWQMKIVPL